MAMRSIEQENIILDLLMMPKYRDLGILEDTFRDVVAHEFLLHKSPSVAEKSARKKIHNIVANYLGHSDYALARNKLTAAFTSNDPENVKTACMEILRTHVSTSERIAEIDKLYQKIFSVTGSPSSILDLACGLNPFIFPWMGLPPETLYYAYDIVSPRIDLINHFFTNQNMQPLAETRDIIVDPPTVAADIALILKEIHRFEQRRKDSSFHLYNSLQVKYLVVSLPAQSIHSKHDFTRSYRALFFKTLHDCLWPVIEMIIGQEMFFIIDKTG